MPPARLFRLFQVCAIEDTDCRAGDESLTLTPEAEKCACGAAEISPGAQRYPRVVGRPTVTQSTGSS
ncbi:hypothetical protein V5799_031721 [Amblyomma americanum]|uniref:Uncharacterized protein n=1 Tax=Amblyomma americanum TaxID=6943 RepID=A0AAQ4DT82_AMBAM